MSQHLSNIAIGSLDPHPNNPRLVQREEVIEAITANINGHGFDPAHALIVRPVGGRYEIVSGHHRYEAAKRAGLNTVAAWVREMDDETAYMELVKSNAQSELTALERGLHALHSGMDVKAYAASIGRVRSTVHNEVYAAEVAEAVPYVWNELSKVFSHLIEVHAAPRWLWSALVEKLIADDLSVVATKHLVASVRELPVPAPWLNAGAIAHAMLVVGDMKPAELRRIDEARERALSKLEKGGLSVEAHTRALHDTLHLTRPARLAEVIEICNAVLDGQAAEIAAEQERQAREREAELSSQRAEHERERRVAGLRVNVSLDAWKTLDAATQQLLLDPGGLTGSPTFNEQKNDAIEWAQWSWNPVTGCLHDCPYCVSGDTPVLMADGRAVPIQALRVGDRIIGTQLKGQYRTLVETEVLAHWKTRKPAVRITLADGRDLVCSADHRWLSNRGWKFTLPGDPGREAIGRVSRQRPVLTTNSSLIGFGSAVVGPAETGIVSIEPLGTQMEMFDITTGTEDFIANGVVSHNCYARDIAESARMDKVYPNGFAPSFRPNALSAPARMKVPKEAASDTRYRNVFTCSMADLFGRWVPAEWIEAVLGAVRANPQWNFLFLTKFPKRMAEFDIPENAWMGTTVDLQARVKNAEAAFAKVKAGVRWLSIEPMLEPLVFERLDLFQWIVIGGASASTKTPAWKPPFEWIADLTQQARDAGVKVYHKTNLLGSRILELPFDAPVHGDPAVAPEPFHYLGKRKAQDGVEA
jgi:ParB/RepB/Spo0J family partition protein